MDGLRHLRAWRWLFIIEGAITVVVAFMAYFILPNFPRTTTWLTEEERQLAAWRLAEDIGQDDWIDSQHQTFGHGLKLAVSDSKMWILVSTRFPIDCCYCSRLTSGRWSCSSVLSPPVPLPTSSPPSLPPSATTTSSPSY